MHAKGPYDYERRHAPTGVRIGFRRLDIDRDFAVYHRWQNEPRTATWWKLAKPEAELRAFLEMHAAQPHQYLYIGCIDNEPMSYWERYWLNGDVLGRAMQHDPWDQGLHLLFGETRFLGQGFMLPVLHAFMDMTFGTDERTARIYAEPDERNAGVLRFVPASAFERTGSVQLPDKKAALLTCERAAFLKEFAHAYVPV